MSKNDRIGGSDMTGQLRQGDVLLVPVDTQPPSVLSPVPEAVLAWGEITGHAHRLRGEVLDWTDSRGTRFVRVTGSEPGSLSHEDHDPVPAAVVSPGQTYRVVPQREWDLSGQWRQVVD